MSKMILAMNVSLDGYVDDLAGSFVMGLPSPELFDYWTQTVRSHAAALYGRRMYEVMRYWDEDRPEWTAPLRDFAVAWRRLPKWVVSRTLSQVGPNATLIAENIEAEVRALKTRVDGTISVSGPSLAGLMTGLGLIDEYHLVLRPFVLGEGKPFFHGARPPLRLCSTDRIDDQTVCLVYAPA
ncbi:MAG: dihydrofolate reductase family protein [Asticcacaulis sp.]|uniref:dihydrofolate reductase family protein n=1 Tax=Asticcacaulis sp. TaxID=1872648 RepID=UPI0039E29DFC